MRFFDCRERILRADSHLKASTERWNDFVEDEPYTVSIDVKSDGTGAISVVPMYDQLPTLFSIELGEMLYQLRAALDSLVYQAAIYDARQDPPPNAQQL